MKFIMSTSCVLCAQNLVRQSQDELDRNNILESWALTVPARVVYACAAIINVVELPFATLAVLFHSLQFIVAWGRHDVYLQESLIDLDLTINHFFCSTMGALISTQLGSWLHANDIRPFEWMLGLSAAAAFTVAAVQVIVKTAPNMIFISSRGDWTFGWVR